MECISLNSASAIMPTPIVNYSVQIYNSMTTLHDNKEFTKEDNMTWLHGLMTAFLLVIIALVLTLAIVSAKCRTLQKRSKLNVYRYAVCITHVAMYSYSSIASSSHCDRFKLDNTITQEEVSNPLYVYADSDNTGTKQNA